jgi:CHAT domain-containing protein
MFHLLRTLPVGGRVNVLLALLLALPCTPPLTLRADEAADVASLGKAANDLSAHMLARRFREAEAAARKLQELSDGPFRDDPAVQVVCLSMISALYNFQGRCDDAEPLMQRVLKLADRLGRPGDLQALQGLEMVALSFNSQHRYVEAERLYRRALAVRERLLGADNPALCNNLIFLGIGSYGQGRRAEAEAFFKRSGDIGEKHPGHPAAAMSLLPLATLYQAQGRHAEAELLVRRVLARHEKSPGTPSAEFVSALDALASLCEDQKRYAEAEKHRRRALELTGKMALLEKAGFESSHMESLARLYRRQGQGRLAEAEKMARQAVAHLEKAYGPRTRSLSSALFELAQVVEARGQPAEALRQINRILTELPVAATPRDLTYRATLHWKAGRRDEALADLRRAMDLAEQERLRVSGAERERAHVFGRHAGVFERMVAWQAELANPGEALQAAERSRARALLDQLELRGVDLLAGVDAAEAGALRRRETQGRIRVASADNRIRLLDGDRNLAAEERQRQRQKLEAELAEARREVVSTYREIRHASPAYRLSFVKGKERRPVALEALRQWVAHSEGLLLEYVLGSEGGHVIVVPGDGRKPRVEKLTVTPEQARVLGADPGPLTLDQAREEAANLLPLLSRPGRTNEAVPRLAALWQVLVPPAERALLQSGKVKRLFVIPDGALAMVPFEALVVDKDKDKDKGRKYLLDLDTPVLYAPSATVLMNLDGRPAVAVPPGREPVLTVGDPAYPEKDAPSGAGPGAGSGEVLASLSPRVRYRARGGRLVRLPHSGAESKWVAENFRDNGIPVAQILGAEATEAKVRAAVAGRRVLHLACHGLTDQEWGNFFGALALTPGNGKQAATAPEDGFLTLAEVHALDLRACELAILSACNSNFGPRQRSEGVWALSGGFLAAGARRVVASNWLVDDEATAALVRAFTARLAKTTKSGAAPDHARALHQAKREVRREDKWQGPYFWASLVLVGPK